MNETANPKKVLCKADLLMVVNEGERRCFNRQLLREPIERMPEDIEALATPIMIHRHIAGQPADPHLRVWLHFSQHRGSSMADIGFDTWAQLVS